MSTTTISSRPQAIRSRLGRARERNHSPHSCRKCLASIGLCSRKCLPPFVHRSIRAVRNLRWFCRNTMARSAIRDRSSDMPESEPQQSSPRAPRLTGASGCHSCRPSGAELPREPARRLSQTMTRAAILLWNRTARLHERGSGEYHDDAGRPSAGTL